jgi:uncharacterized protein
MNETPTTRKIPAPLLNPEAAPYFEAVGQGRLLYRFCSACAKAHHPPRTICPYCQSDSTEWKTSAGLATVYSSSLLRRGTPVPYCVAYVTLDEGVTLMTSLEGFGQTTPAVGTRVKVRFVLADGSTPVPIFTPLELT